MLTDNRDSWWRLGGCFVAIMGVLVTALALLWWWLGAGAVR